MTEFRAALDALVATLADEVWFVFGAQAVNAWGVPRQTLDIDVTIAISDIQIAGLVARLESAGFSPRVADAEAFASQYAVIPTIHASGVPVDIVLAGTPFEREALARRRIVTVYEVDVPMVGPEDLVVFKLSSDRGKDYDDAAGVIRAHARDLDADLIRGYLRASETALDRSDLVRSFDALLAAALRRAH